MGDFIQKKVDSRESSFIKKFAYRTVLSKKVLLMREDTFAHGRVYILKSKLMGILSQGIVCSWKSLLIEKFCHGRVCSLEDSLMEE